MIWFLIEAGVALLLLIFIVWWTCPGARAGKTAMDPRRAHDPTGWRGRMGVFSAPLVSRADRPGQCRTRGILSVNSGMGASNEVPSSATIW